MKANLYFSPAYAARRGYATYRLPDGREIQATEVTATFADPKLRWSTQGNPVDDQRLVAEGVDAEFVDAWRPPRRPKDGDKQGLEDFAEFNTACRKASRNFVEKQRQRYIDNRKGARRPKDDSHVVQGKRKPYRPKQK